MGRDPVSAASKVVFHIAKLNKKRLSLIGRMLDGELQDADQKDSFLENLGIVNDSKISIGTLIIALVLAIRQLNARIDELERKIENLSA